MPTNLYFTNREGGINTDVMTGEDLECILLRNMYFDYYSEELEDWTLFLPGIPAEGTFVNINQNEEYLEDFEDNILGIVRDHEGEIESQANHTDATYLDNGTCMVLGYVCQISIMSDLSIFDHKIIAWTVIVVEDDEGNVTRTVTAMYDFGIYHLVDHPQQTITPGSGEDLALQGSRPQGPTIKNWQTATAANKLVYLENFRVPQIKR